MYQKNEFIDLGVFYYFVTKARRLNVSDMTYTLSLA